MNNKVNICFVVNGGVGTVLARLNFVKCFYDKFKNYVNIYIYAHSNQEINAGILEGQDFFVSYDNSYLYNERYADKKYDVTIVLDALPIVRKYEKIERFIVANVSYNLHKVLLSWNDFFRERGCEKYSKWIRESKTDLYMHLINKKANVLTSPDIYNDLDIDSKNYTMLLKTHKDYDYILKNNGLKNNSYITVQFGCNSKLGTVDIPKLWPKSYFCELVVLLKKKYPNKKIVQLGEGSQEESYIEGVDVNLLNETNFEELKVLLKNSYLHIDSECGMVHIRKALEGGPSVVFFGPTPVDFFGYDGNINISTKACSSWCAEIDDSWEVRCPLGQEKPKCMYSITPTFVMERINEWEEKSKFKLDMPEPLDVLIYKKYGFKIDKEYYDRWLSKQVVVGFHDDFIKLKDLKFQRYVGTKNSKNIFEYRFLTDSYVYQYLVGNKQAYYDEMKLRESLDDNPHNEKRLISLLKKLDKKIDDNRVILIDANNNIIDGFHRASYFLYKNGEDYEIRLLRIYLPYIN